MTKLAFDIAQNKRGSAWVVRMFFDGKTISRATYPISEFYPESHLLTKREAAGIASVQAWSAAYDAGETFLKMYA